MPQRRNESPRSCVRRDVAEEIGPEFFWPLVSFGAPSRADCGRIVAGARYFSRWRYLQNSGPRLRSFAESARVASGSIDRPLGTLAFGDDLALRRQRTSCTPDATISAFPPSGSYAREL